VSDAPQGQRASGQRPQRGPWRFIVAAMPIPGGSWVLDCGHYAPSDVGNEVRTLVGAPGNSGDQCRCIACFRACEESLANVNLLRGAGLR
jgi:hypothetical protein